MLLKPEFKDKYKGGMMKSCRSWKRWLNLPGFTIIQFFVDEETNTLFAVQKQDGVQSSQDLGDNPVVQKWWTYMSDIMETNVDNSPVSIPMEEVFYLD